MTDLLIIGGGPAGLTAALYAARAGKTVTVFEQYCPGGQIIQTQRVDNYPGLPGIDGPELGDRLCRQATDAGAKLECTGVSQVRRSPDGTFTADTGSGPMEARAVIFAGGARPRPLDVPGEAALVGRGVSYCALCDGALFRKQDVAVVGGGSTAFSDALHLSQICRSVTLVHRRRDFRAEAALVDAAKAVPNVRFLVPCSVTALHGTDRLEGLTVLQLETGEEIRLPVRAVFAAVGRQPDCGPIARLVDLDETGYILAGEDCRTKTPGLFAAGDCRQKAVRQLTTAISDGTAAAVGACKYLE